MVMEVDKVLHFLGNLRTNYFSVLHYQMDLEIIGGLL